MNFRRKYPNATTLVMGMGALLLLSVMLKHLYDNNQKCNRINGYQQLMQELSDHMQSVELAANKSSMNVYQLNRVIEQQHQQIAQKLEVGENNGIKKTDHISMAR